MKKILIISISLILLFSFASCTSDNTASKTEKKISIELSIDYPYKDKMDIEKVSVNVNNDGTVLTALKEYANNHNIILGIENGSYTYVTSIDNIRETKTSGWIYKLNGATLLKAADEQPLKDGDVIEWSMTRWE